MNDDALEKNLPKAFEEDEAAPEPTPEFRAALLAETTRALPRPRGRLVRILGLVTATAAAALLVLSALVFGPGGPGAVPGEPAAQEPASADLSRVVEARAVPAFRAEGLASRVYEDPVEYLRKGGADVTVAGLVALWRRTAAGEDPGIEMSKWAVLDALSQRAGTAFAPLLTELWDMDADPQARRWILLMLTRVRDRVVAPWLDARLADAPAALLRDVAKARVALHLPDPAAAAALRANAGESGDPEILYAIAALGHPDVLDDFARALAAAPTPDLAFAAWTALRGRPAPEAFRTALDMLTVAALAKDDTSYDDLKVLDLLAQTGDERFAALLGKLLADDYVPLAVDAARTAGAWRVKGLLPLLRATWERAKRMGEDGEDLIPVVLWAAGRCGDGDAVPRLLAFLRVNEWYRAGEWAVDALLDLGAPVGEILLALPGATWSVGRLPDLLDRVTMADFPAVEGKIASLEDGPLKSALVLARRLGAGPEVRDYLRTVVAKGGNLGLYLTFGDPEKVRATLQGGGDHDATLALRAIPMLPMPPEGKRALAAAALARDRPRIRAEAAGALARLGGEDAIAALGSRLHAETSPFVRERIVLALGRLGKADGLHVLLGPVAEGSRLAEILATEARFRAEPGVIQARLGGKPRYAKADPAASLFDYEVSR